MKARLRSLAGVSSPDVIETPILAMGVGTEDQIIKRQLPPDLIPCPI